MRIRILYTIDNAKSNRAGLVGQGVYRVSYARSGLRPTADGFCLSRRACSGDTHAAVNGLVWTAGRV
jgi:hypothetical protein